MEITEEIIEKTAEMLKGHLDDYSDQIGAAYSDNEENLKITLGAKYSFKKGKFKIETSINFTTEQIKDNMVLYYDPAQAEFNFNFDGSRNGAGENEPDD